jgi:hypothetical protein
MEKYKDIFKNWWFWIFFIILSFYQCLVFLAYTENLTLGDIIGVSIGAFISSLIFFSFIFVIQRIIKIVKRNKKNK